MDTNETNDEGGKLVPSDDLTPADDLPVGTGPRAGDDSAEAEQE